MFDYGTSLQTRESYTKIRSAVAKLFMSGIADLGIDSEQSILAFCERDRVPVKSALNLLEKLHAMDFLDEAELIAIKPNK